MLCLNNNFHLNRNAQVNKIIESKSTDEKNNIQVKKIKYFNRFLTRKGVKNYLINTLFITKRNYRI